MASYGFWFRSGTWELDTQATQASSALVPGDSCVNASGTLDIGTTSNKIVGVSLGTKAVGDSATTAVQYIRTNGSRTRWLAFAVAGTIAATDEMTFQDLSGASGAQGVDADTTTHDDLFIDKVLVAGLYSATAQPQMIVNFADPAYLQGVN